MKRFVILFLLLSAPALAGERPVSHYQEIPDPIPLDFNQCVWAFSTQKGRDNGLIGKAAQWTPPLSKKALASLEYYRREGWAKLTPCRERES